MKKLITIPNIGCSALCQRYTVSCKIYVFVLAASTPILPTLKKSSCCAKREAMSK